MASFQFRIWRFLIKTKFSKQDIDSDIDIGKARKMDAPDPPKRMAKRFIIEKQDFSGRTVFHLKGKKPGERKILLYFHGGAFISGITKIHWDFLDKLSLLHNYHIILPDHPLAPEANFKETTRFIFELYKQLLYDYQSSDLYVMGDSSGGNLSLTLSLMLSKHKLLQPNKIILLSPWLDLSMSNPVIKDLEKREVMLSSKKLIKTGILYSGESDLRNPFLSPIYGDLKGLPETHLFTSDHDILYADSKKLKEVSEESGLNIHFYEYEKMMHVWMLFPMPEAKKVIDQISRILEDAE